MLRGTGEPYCSTPTSLHLSRLDEFAYFITSKAQCKSSIIAERTIRVAVLFCVNVACDHNLELGMLCRLDVFACFTFRYVNKIPSVAE